MPTATKKRPKKKKVKHTQGEAEKLLAAIEKQEDLVEKADLHFRRLKDQAKAAKESFSDAVTVMRNLIRASKNDSQRPLLTNGEAAPAANGQTNGQAALTKEVGEALKDKGILAEATK